MKGCSSCGGAKKPSMPSGKNAPNPFQKSTGIKIGKPAGTFGKPTIKTNFKFGK